MLSARTEVLTGAFEAVKGPLRVLHVVENLDSQAVESWLLRVLRASHEGHPLVHWTFFCVLGREGRYDDLARGLGAEVIHSQYEIGDKLRFIRSLREEMKRGNYDVLHCHHDVMSAVYLLASKGLPFQKRIVHVHNTSLSLPTPNRLKANLAREPMRQMCLRMADQIVGISKEALASMIVNGKADPAHHSVVHIGVDTERLSRARLDRDGFRKELNFDPGTKVLLFVGRLVSYKNPSFVVEILEHLLKIRPDVVAVFAGAGDQEDEIMEMARQKNLASKVRLLGFRDDVAELMVNSDVLIWPGREEIKEGLGLGIVEAQAAGLPVLMSHSVPLEAVVVRELVKRLQLSDGAKAWAAAIAQILQTEYPSREDSLAKVESSSFSLAQGVSNLMRLYLR